MSISISRSRSRSGPRVEKINGDHSGFIESCHKSKDASWYKKQKDRNGHYVYCQDFCEKLETGGFIPCGNSGGILFSFYEDGRFNCIDGGIVPKGYETCCFVTGWDCKTKKLRRRWSCCGNSIYGTFYEMNKLGCKRKD